LPLSTVWRLQPSNNWLTSGQLTAGAASGGLQGAYEAALFGTIMLFRPRLR